MADAPSSHSACPACHGARVEVILNTVLPCGRCGGSGLDVDLGEDLRAVNEAAAHVDPNIDVLAELMKRGRQ